MLCGDVGDVNLRSVKKAVQSGFRMLFAFATGIPTSGQEAQHWPIQKLANRSICSKIGSMWLGPAVAGLLV